MSLKTGLINTGTKRHLLSSSTRARCGAAANRTGGIHRSSMFHSVEELNDASEITCAKCRALFDTHFAAAFAEKQAAQAPVAPAENSSDELEKMQAQLDEARAQGFTPDVNNFDIYDDLRELQAWRKQQAVVAPAPSMLRREYSIYKEKLEGLRKSIDKLNRAAAKLSLPLISFEIVKEYQVEEYIGEDMFLSPVYQLFDKLDIVITGEAPVVSGYELAAMRSRISVETDVEGVKTLEDSVIIRKFPAYSSELPAPYCFKSHAIACEHCKSKRRRNDSYVLVNTETSKLIEVGSSCLASFLGKDKLATAAAHATYLDALNKFFSSAGDDYTPRSSSIGYILSSFLTVAAAAIRAFGFVSRKEEHSYVSTYERVLDAFHCFKTGNAINFSIDEQDKATADATIAFVKETLAAKEMLNDYESSLVTLFAAPYLPEKFAGLAASAVSAYLKHLAEQAKVVVVSEFVGSIGERRSFDKLTVVNIHSFETRFGYTTIYSFQDAAGNLVSWFSSGDFDANIGEIYSGKATIIEHKVYREQKTTYVKRAKLERIDEKASV